MHAKECALAVSAGVGAGIAIGLCISKLSHFFYKLKSNAERSHSKGKNHGRQDGVECNWLKPDDLDTDDIISEQLTRNIQFFGLKSQKKISDSFVVVVGLGGVGSHAAHMLLRAGVGRLRLVDFDQVSLSSLNRHCLATREDVGTSKSRCLEKYFRRIMPETRLECMCVMYCKETEDAILADHPDYVIDAIDNIDTKIDLLAACKNQNIQVLSVAGAGAKADPTRLRFVDVAESNADPLARAVRHRLRRDYNISCGIPILLSTEKPRCGLVAAGDSDDVAMAEYRVIPNFRIRTIPVLGTTPAIFGMAAASYVLCGLAGQDIISEPIFRVSEKSLVTQYCRLESRLGREPGVDQSEVEVLVREIFRGMSARAVEPPAPKKALSRDIGDLVLTIWNPSKPDTIDNLVLLTQEEANRHDLLVNKPGGFDQLCSIEPDFVRNVEKKLQRARINFMYSYY